jgi:hypothetical protein
MRKLVLVLSLLSCPAVAADRPASNAALQALKEQDQAARSGSAIDWYKVAEEDTVRRAEVMKLVATGALMTAEDYINAALIFQHGQQPEDIRMAFSMSTIAIRLDPESKRAKSLSASNWDRILMRLEKPQWYGTQFKKDHVAGGKWELYQIDETAVTDADRKALYVPTLEEAKAHVQTLNARSQ